MPDEDDEAFDPNAIDSAVQSPNSTGPAPDAQPQPLTLNDTSQQSQIDDQNIDLPTSKTGYRGVSKLLKQSKQMPPPVYSTPMDQPVSTGGDAPTNAAAGASDVPLPPLNDTTPNAPTPVAPGTPVGAPTAQPAAPDDSSVNNPADLANTLADGQSFAQTVPGDPGVPAPPATSGFLTRPAAPSSNWAQRLALAGLSLTRFAPAANEIIHPKWSQQASAYQAQQADIQQQADIAAKQGKAVQETAAAAKALQQAANGDRKFKVVNGSLLNTETGEITELPQTVQEKYNQAMAINPDPQQAIVYALGGKVEQLKPPDTKGLVTVTPEMANQLKDFGVSAGDQLPVATHTKYLDIIQKRQVDPNAKIPKGDELEWIASDPNETPERRTTAQAALKMKAQQAAASRPVTNITNLTPEALDQSAQRYLQTGELPSLGMGSAAAAGRYAILNRAAELSGTSNIASNRANYRADSGSLAAIQKNRDSVVAFENTAGKNLDLFTQQAKPLIDSGSQWINSPVRQIDRAGLGSADVAAYDAARQVALNEIAKVTSNPGLTGQLSDSARKEVASLIPESATLSQIYKVANVLKADMKNRHDSYDQQIKEIQGRIAKPNSPAPPPSGIDLNKFEIKTKMKPNQ